MFRKDITFVIGAGASYEYGLPIGSELAKSIKRSAAFHMDGDGMVMTAHDAFFLKTIKRVWPATDERIRVREALKVIKDGIHTAVSIDAFIHRFRNAPLISQLGKMLIALEIAKAERLSTLHPLMINNRPIDAKHPDETWLGHFVRILIDGVEVAENIGRDVNIICFNYDRCIEYYLRDSIAAAFDIPINEAGNIVDGINIIHPYGTLGELSLDDYNVDDGELPFGAELDDDVKLEEIAKSIRTYTEQFESAGDIERIHNAVATNNTMVFLGFGFNNQNLDLLRVQHLKGLKMRNIYATGKGIAMQVDDTLRRRVANIFSLDSDNWKHKVNVEYGLTCLQLFETHHMNMSRFIQRFVGSDGEGNPKIINVPMGQSD